MPLIAPSQISDRQYARLTLRDLQVSTGSMKHLLSLKFNMSPEKWRLENYLPFGVTQVGSIHDTLLRQDLGGCFLALLFLFTTFDMDINKIKHKFVCNRSMRNHKQESHNQAFGLPIFNPKVNGQNGGARPKESWIKSKLSAYLFRGDMSLFGN